LFSCTDTKGFNDDSRLSKLVRRVIREDDRERKWSALKQLKDYLSQPENSKVNMVDRYRLKF